MSLDNSASQNADSDQSLVQFEDCTYDTNCKWRDTNGKCVFETCIVQNELPPAQTLWMFKCIACGEIDSIKPNDMKIHLCASCIKRLQAAETLPFTCIICGSSQNHPSKGFSTPICDDCLSRLNRSAHCTNCGNG